MRDSPIPTSPQRVPSSMLKNIHDKQIDVVTGDGLTSPLRGINNIEDVDPLGNGSQSRVWAVEVTFSIDGSTEKRRCVLKEMPRAHRRFSEDDPRTPTVNPFEKHIVITAGDESSTDNNIIHLIELVTHNGKKYALLPYCPFFLDNLLEELETCHPILHQAVVLQVMLDLLYALNHLHNDLNHIHGDINPSNIAWYNGSFCLLDLDCAREITSAVTATSGSIYYTHPASHYNLEKHGSDPCNDLWALGKVLEQLLLQPVPTLTNRRDFMREQASAYKNAFKAACKDETEMRYEGRVHPETHSFSGAFEAAQSIPEKLSVIAQSMTSILPSQQPSIETLIDALNALKDDLLRAEHDPRVLKKELEDLYSLLASNSVKIFPDFTSYQVSESSQSLFIQTPSSPGSRRGSRTSIDCGARRLSGDSYSSIFSPLSGSGSSFQSTDQQASSSITSQNFLNFTLPEALIPK